MNRETLAGCIQSREFFESVEPYVSFTNQLDSGLFEVVRDYYRTDERASHVDLVYLQHILRLGTKTEAAKDRFVAYATELSQQVVDSLSNVRAYTLRVREESLNHKLAEQLMSPNRDKALVDSLMQQIQDLQAGGNDSDVLHNLDIEELARSYSEEGILFGCESFRARLGYGARPGHHIVIKARPDIGKTFFAVDCAASVAEQGMRVAYAGNEEPITTTAVRMVCRLARMSLAAFVRNPARANQLARERGYENIYFLDLKPGYLGQLGSHMKRIKPALCVVDQIRNMQADSENNTQRLEVIARGIRNLGKIHEAVMMSLTQAGDSAEGKQILGLSDLDGSKTGIQGTADMQCGIGANATDVEHGVRHCSFPKNKISGDNTPFMYSVDKQTSMVVG